MQRYLANAYDPCCNPLASADLFKQFLNERRYLKNVTGDTIEWYDTAWKAFQRTLNKTAPPITKTSPDVLEGLKDLDDASVVLVFRRHHGAGYAFQALVLLMS
ncbi:MAG: hypothetical protein DMG00_22300 [Acidobacteria bacterium]|nr:MAG: hypothetical protein DMG00_22300 [Acidobacteriota bacterium]